MRSYSKFKIVMRYLYTPTFLLICMLSSLALQAQQPMLTTPQASPKAQTTQYIGLSDITVTYHRPMVKGREVYGKLVPYDRMWRAGANENTVVTLSHEATVNGSKLPAGTYGLHMIPTEKEWTIVFSSDHDSWGSYFYRKENDVLRVTTKTKACEHEEALSYTFNNVSSTSCDMVMAWGKLSVPITFEFDVHAIVVANMEKELMGVPGFYPQGWQEIATYAVNNEVALDKAEGWIDRSMSRGKTFANLNTKARLYKLQGKNAEAEKLMDEAMAMATETEINAYGYQLMNEGNTKKALEIFTLNTKKHSDSWNCWDSLGEAYLSNGDKAKAKKYYSKARKMAPADQHARIDGVMADL